MTSPKVSVLLGDHRFVDTLMDQQCELVQLLVWDDAGWGDEVAARAAERGWQVVRTRDGAAAVTASSSEFVVEWNVYEASADALESLVHAAAANPDKRGALTANFDPLVLWRRDWCRVLWMGLAKRPCQPV